MNNSDPRFTLHHSAASPFARKVRAVAIELGLEERLHYTQVSVAQGTENAAYAKDVNPLERIPAMTLEDGTTLVDSALICQYLNETTGGTLVPESGKHRWDVLNALSITDGMTEMAVQLRYETFARPEPHRWEAYVADLNRRIVNSLDWLDAHATPEPASTIDNHTAPTEAASNAAMPAGTDQSDSSNSSNRSAGATLGRLMPFLRPYRGRILIAAGALLVAAAATLALPLAFRFLIDRGFNTTDAMSGALSDDVTLIFVGLFCLAVLLALTTAIRFYCVSWLGDRIVARLRV